MKNFPETGAILSELSPNTLPDYETYSLGCGSLREQGSLPKDTHLEPGASDVCPSFAQQIQPSHPDSDQGYETAQSSGLLSNKSKDSLSSGLETAPPPNDNSIEPETSSRNNESPSLNLNSRSAEESEMLVENHNGDQRKTFLKSILKSKRPTPYSTSPGHDVISSDIRSQQVTLSLGDKEIQSKTESIDHLDSHGGLVVFVPVTMRQKSSKKRVVQLAAMSICGFILVSIILAWVFSPTFL